MRSLWLLMLFVLVSGARAEPLHAQTILGQLVSSEDGQPVGGGFVLLLDEAGNRQAAAITDATGRFTLRAASPGRYRLQAERIGFDNVISPVLELGSGTLAYRFEVQARAVRLSDVDVQSSGRGCERRPDAPEVYTLWNEIRKALSVASFSEQSRRNRQFSLFQYTRTLDPALSTLLSETRAASRSPSALPFAAVPAEDLATDGFVQPDGEEWTLFGPDADVLLSDVFLDSHCFRIETGVDPALIGLGFAPLSGTGPPDIQGALWVDRQTGELRRISWEYVNLPSAGGEQASGEARYMRLADGSWVVQQWWIRSSMMEVTFTDTRSGQLRRTLRVAGLLEKGGAVTGAGAAGADILPQSGSGAIAGAVVDSLTGRAEAGIALFVSGAPYETVTDQRGWYLLDAPPGRHPVAVQHPALLALGLPLPLDSVEVRAGMTTPRDFGIPSLPTVLRSLCAGEPDERAPAMAGLVWGYVTDAATGAPLRDLEVRADWVGVPRNGAGAARDRWRTARTDDEGRFNLCWLPETADVMLRVREGRNWGPQTTVNLATDHPAIRRQDLMQGNGR